VETEIFEIGLGNHDTKTRLEAANDYVSFWETQARSLKWFKEWDTPLTWNPPFARWFLGGRINASYNALDVHKNRQKTAIFWEGENQDRRTISYEDLLTDVQKLANALKSIGVQKGDRITIYLPMVPEITVAMLACARIGAIHTVIFSGFSASSIRDRVLDSKSKVIITADGGYRRGSVVKLKDTIDDAIKDLDFVQNVIVLKRADIPINLENKDIMWSRTHPVCVTQKIYQVTTHCIFCILLALLENQRVYCMILAAI
jgi:acetyl-CoA synthetase